MHRRCNGLQIRMKGTVLVVYIDMSVVLRGQQHYGTGQGQGQAAKQQNGGNELKRREDRMKSVELKRKV